MDTISSRTVMQSTQATSQNNVYLTTLSTGGEHLRRAQPQPYWKLYV